MTIEISLDVKGLNCPLPMLKAKKVLATMQGGQTLEVWATDKNVCDDFKAFCHHTGHQLLICEQADGNEAIFRILVKRKDN